MHKDNLAWVDEEYKAERKALLKPTPEQEGMAHMLEHDLGGGYVLLGTGTFRPNQYEEIVQHKEGDKKDQFTRNMKVSWIEGEKIVKRVGRDGQMTKGTRGVSPGWSPHAAERAGLNFILKDPQLRKTRWFMCVEGSKYRNCAHLHFLFANAHKVPWEKVANKWEEKYGRFRIELVDDKDGMAMYLAKQYVGKEYGSDDFRYKFSRNSRNPLTDPVPKIAYDYRMQLFRNNMRKDETKKHKMLRWKTFLQTIGVQ